MINKWPRGTRNRIPSSLYGKRHARRVAKPLNRGDRAMNNDIIQGNWTELKGKVQKQWGKLTNDDLDQIEGDRKQLVGRVQQRYGYAKDQAEREVDSFVRSMH
jgi:uncharacterized protein YjbJ (UPF0337 family)